MRTICGTHKYLAPELVQCDRGQLQGYDKAIDMWGVGARRPRRFRRPRRPRAKVPRAPRRRKPPSPRAS